MFRLEYEKCSRCKEMRVFETDSVDQMIAFLQDMSSLGLCENCKIGFEAMKDEFRIEYEKRKQDYLEGKS